MSAKFGASTRSEDLSQAFIANGSSIVSGADGPSAPPSSTKPLATVAVASERWNVEKRRLEFDREIDSFHREQVAKCIAIDKLATEKATKLYNDIFFKSKWANPPFPAVHRRLILGFCKHVLVEGSMALFPQSADLKVWHRKAVGSFHEKTAAELERLCTKLWNVIHQRDMEISRCQAELLLTTEKMNVKKDGTLRWMMQGNSGRKDQVFSIWFLAANNKIRELEVLLRSAAKRRQYSALGINGECGVGSHLYRCDCKQARGIFIGTQLCVSVEVAMFAHA